MVALTFKNPYDSSTIFCVREKEEFEFVTLDQSGLFSVGHLSIGIIHTFSLHKSRTGETFEIERDVRNKSTNSFLKSILLMIERSQNQLLPMVVIRRNGLNATNLIYTRRLQQKRHEGRCPSSYRRLVFRQPPIALQRDWRTAR